MPALQLAASRSVPPRRSSPSRSACSTIARQMRSFTLPPGLRHSSFAHISARSPASWGRRESRTTGVDPIKSSAVPATWHGSGMNALSAIGAREHIRGVRAGSIQDLVLIFPGALGDLLLALPTLQRLRRRHRPACTTLVVAGPQRDLAHLAGIADRVASLDEAGAAWLFGGEAVPRWLAPGATVFSWLGPGDPTLRMRLSDIAAAAYLLSVERGPGRVHAAVAYARAAGVPAERGRLAADAGIAPPESARARRLVADLGRPLLVVHRGAGAHAKRWAADGFAAVAGWWRRWRGDVVELLGPAEAGETPLDGAAVACGWSLPDVAALLALSDAYVGNDSGVSHLAGAVGARGVVVFGPTDPARWRPLSSRLVALRARAGGRSRPSSDDVSDRVCRTLARLSAGSATCARSGSAS